MSASVHEHDTVAQWLNLVTPFASSNAEIYRNITTEIKYQLSSQLNHDTSLDQYRITNYSGREIDSKSNNFKRLNPDLAIYAGFQTKNIKSQSLFQNPVLLIEIEQSQQKDFHFQELSNNHLLGYLFVRQDTRKLTMYRKNASGWYISTHYEGAIDLPGIPASLNIDMLYDMAEVYDEY